MPDGPSLDGTNRIEGTDKKIGKNVSIGKGTVISGRNVTIEDNVTLGDNARITAQNIVIGFGSRIEEGCRLALPGEGSRLVLGDNCIIGSDTKIIVPVFEAGDYLTLHNHGLVNGLKPVKIGHNVWIGQNCILNSNEALTIGNGVGIGAYSCVYTHGFFGELLEGCQVYKVAPVTIEDDAWIVGSFNIISPGVKVGRRAIILTGSVLTRDAPPFTCWGGNPARDITAKVPTYRTVGVDEKFDIMKGYMDEFIEKYYKVNARRHDRGWTIDATGRTMEIIFIPVHEDASAAEQDSIRIIFTKMDRATKPHPLVTVFDLSSKRYTKRRSKLEIEIIKFLSSTKARFLPI
jgi:acetyltransferase-like isoleucine patch superfamily enzyme